MKKDEMTFFSQPDCDRCAKPLDGIRTMSWFIEECICMKCSDDEKVIKSKLVNSREYEGCGFIPTV